LGRDSGHFPVFSEAGTALNFCFFFFKKKEEVPAQVTMQSYNLQGVLEQVYELNEASINKKTDLAFQTANQVTLFMVILGFCFFVFAVSSMFYFPDYIADPINQLIQSIQEISRKNYSLRLEVNSNDEFGELASAFNEMAERLDEYESLNVSQILTEKSRIETIISQMNDAIIGLDRKNTILFANPKAAQLFGKEETELIGRSASAVARENALVRRVVKEVIVNDVQAYRKYPAVTVRKGGKVHYFEKDILQVLNKKGTQDGFVIILKNITAFKEQDLAKTNFMATLSHELKTPISAIDMSLGLLRDDRIGKLNEEQQDLAKTIEQNSQRLLNMVNEILDISRIETGNIHITRVQASPDNLVERAIDATKTFVVERGVQLQKSIQPELPELLLDVEKTSGVLINFLTNAIRYSKQDDLIRIDVAQKNGVVEFSVTDQGPGISREDQKKIFKKYSRAKNDKTKGTGLGLAISKEFIEKQGGKIWVKSEVGKGSRFTFSLPVGKK
jgi:PAS domain S-box-containing protein